MDPFRKGIHLARKKSRHSLLRLLFLLPFVLVVLNQSLYQTKAELIFDQTSGVCGVNIATGIDTRQSITINGQPSKTCSLQITAFNDSAALILVPQNYSEADFLYIERQDIGCRRPSRDQYVSINGQNLENGPSCRVVLFDRQFKLTVQGEVEILIRDIPIQQHQTQSICANIVDATKATAPAAGINGSQVCRVTGYNSVYECNLGGELGDTCTFNFPSNCNATLPRPNEVTLDCLDSDLIIPDNTKSLLFYPSNFSTLDLADKNIIKIAEKTFKYLRDLTSLELKKNRIRTLIDGTFDGLNQLFNLSVKSNEIISISSDLFQSLTKLQFLSMAKNKLTMLPIGVFKNLNKLTYLNIGRNPLHMLDGSLFRGLQLLSELDLRNTRLVTLPADIFKGLHSLRLLSMQENNLIALPPNIFEDLTNLTNLYLGVNKLTSVDVGLFERNSALEILDMSVNMLHKIPRITHLVQLRQLYLENNTFKLVTVHDLSGLRQPADLVVSQPEICECYTPAGVNCSANKPRSPYLTCDRLLTDRVLVVFMWLIGFSAIGGNVFVLLWRNTHVTKHKVQSRLVLNLAFSDFLMGIYMIIIASADIGFGINFPIRAEIWRTGVTCRIAGLFSVLSSEASVFFVTLISIDRLICIKYPYTAFKFGKKSIAVAVLLIWTFAGALGIIPAILSGTNPDIYDNSHVCIGIPLALVTSYSTHVFQKKFKIAPGIKIKKTFVISQVIGSEPGMYFATAIFIGLNSICYIIILTCYVMILKTIYKKSRQHGLNQDIKDQLRLTTKVTAIVATDFLCWCPIIVLGILVQIEVITLPPSAFAWVVTFILPFNSAINPYLYTITDLLDKRRKKKTDQLAKTALTEGTDQGLDLGAGISNPRSIQLSATTPQNEEHEEMVIFPDAREKYGSAETHTNDNIS